MNDAPAPKRRGRPPGSGLGPRPGSRPWMLAQLAPGESMLLEIPSGRSRTGFMQQIQTDVQRVGLTGKVQQRLVVGVLLEPRAVIDIVRVTRLP